MISAINNSGPGAQCHLRDRIAGRLCRQHGIPQRSGGIPDTGINISAPNVGTGTTAGVIGSFVSTKTGADTATTMAGLALAGTLSLGGE